MGSFGERIRELRRQQDLSLREFAARLGDLTAPYLSDIELGRRYPSEDVLQKMASVLKEPVENLRALDPRPPLEQLKQRGTKDPQLAVALRQVLERKVSGDDLMKILEQLKKDKVDK